MVPFAKLFLIFNAYIQVPYDPGKTYKLKYNFGRIEEFSGLLIVLDYPLIFFQNDFHFIPFNKFYI